MLDEEPLSPRFYRAVGLGLSGLAGNLPVECIVSRQDRFGTGFANTFIIRDGLSGGVVTELRIMELYDDIARDIAWKLESNCWSD